MLKFWRPIFHEILRLLTTRAEGGWGTGGEGLAAGTLTERKTLLCFAGILCGGARGGGGGGCQEKYT